MQVRLNVFIHQDIFGYNLALRSHDLCKFPVFLHSGSQFTLLQQSLSSFHEKVDSLWLVTIRLVQERVLSEKMGVRIEPPSDSVHNLDEFAIAFQVTLSLAKDALGYKIALILVSYVLVGAVLNIHESPRAIAKGNDAHLGCFGDTTATFLYLNVIRPLKARHMVAINHIEFELLLRSMWIIFKPFFQIFPNVRLIKYEITERLLLSQLLRRLWQQLLVEFFPVLRQIFINEVRYEVIKLEAERQFSLTQITSKVNKVELVYTDNE